MPTESVTVVTWEEAIADFAAGLKVTKALKTQTFYATHLNQLRLWVNDHCLSVAEFRARHMRKYMAERADQVAEQTRLHDVNCARVFLRFCHREGYSAVNALANYEAPRPQKSQVKCPTQKEIDQLLKAIQQRWDPKLNVRARYLDEKTRHFIARRDYAIVVFLIETACRLGEAFHIAMSDFDREKLTATFRDTKNKETRTVPVTGTLIAAMQPWLTQRDRIARDAKGDEARGVEARCVPNLFLTLQGESVDVAGWGKSFRGYLEFGKIERFTRHGIRHFTLTRLAEKNVLSAREIAGHKSLAVTQGYLHPNQDRVRADHAEAAPLGSILQTKKTAQMKRRKRVTG
jgi:site-specific recombinase XerD